MKKIIVVFGLILMSFSGYSQSKNFIDQPYLETKATYTTKVTPDRIYLTILINEKDTKGKIAVDELENKMYNSLKNMGIDTDKQLKLADLTSNFKKFFLKKTDILKNKSYSLVVYDAQTAGKVILELERINISNINLEKVEYSKLEELKIELREKAVLKAKSQAEHMLKPLGQKLGKALYINDNTGINPGFVSRINSYNESRVFKQSANAEPTDIAFEQIEVQSLVTVYFAIE